MAALNWDSTIENDGGDFRLLEPGVYPFRVKNLNKSFHNGSTKIPACPKAELLLRVGEGADASDVTDNLLLDDSLEWKLCEFFRSIGARAHSEKFQMNWNDVTGKTGLLEIEHREYVKDGETRYANQVKRYLDPNDKQEQKPAEAQAEKRQTW